VPRGSLIDIATAIRVSAVNDKRLLYDTRASINDRTTALYHVQDDDIIRIGQDNPKTRNYRD
jgi:hypothetical protein